MKKLPDFLIIGAARCGTSSFYKMLLQHPRITGPANKEIHFFDSEKHYAKGVTWYLMKLPDAERGKLICEATPIYLHCAACPERITRWLPQSRLIVLLRDPTIRAWSHFWANRNRHNLRNPQILVNGNPMGRAIKERGLYYDQLIRWLRFYANGQMGIVKSETFFEYPQKILNRISTELLKLEPFDFKEIYWDPKKKDGEKVPSMPPDIEQKLRRYYAPANRKLNKLVGVDFKWR